QQYSFTTSQRSRLSSLRLFFCCLCYHGQIYPEGRAFARFAVNIDIAAMLFDYPIDPGQAKPRTLADFLCREEWLKYILPGLLVHTNTGVRYRKNGIHPCPVKKISFSITAVNIEYSSPYG